MRNVVCLLTPARGVAVVLTALALVALFSTPARVPADEPIVLGDEFVVLLKGIYQPIPNGPDLGLSRVDLSDGVYSKTKIYHISGLPVESKQAIGNFYFNDATGDRCAYQLPGGAMSALIVDYPPAEEVVRDGELYLEGIVRLVILEGTGIYRPFVEGSIYMEYSTRVILDEETGAVLFDEFCICYVSR